MDAKFIDQAVLPQPETPLSGWASEAQRLLLGAKRTRPARQSSGTRLPVIAIGRKTRYYNLRGECGRIWPLFESGWKWLKMQRRPRMTSAPRF
jgi:hypothetical protein